MAVSLLASRMNQNLVLQKCVDELSQDNPKLDYVRGMLETLVSLNTVEITPTTTPATPIATFSTPSGPAEPDEAAILDAETRRMLGQIDTTITLEG